MDELYKDIGKKIKDCAKGIFVVEAVAAALIGMIMIANDNAELGIIVLIVGAVAAWISSWLLYALGQVVDDIHALRQKHAPESYVAGAVQVQPVYAQPRVTPQPQVATQGGAQQTGKCAYCDAEAVLTYCEIKDDMGTYYRNLCPACMAKYNAVPKG